MSLKIIISQYISILVDFNSYSYYCNGSNVESFNYYINFIDFYNYITTYNVHTLLLQKDQIF